MLSESTFWPVCLLTFLHTHIYTKGIAMHLLNEYLRATCFFDLKHTFLKVKRVSSGVIAHVGIQPDYHAIHSPIWALSVALGMCLELFSSLFQDHRVHLVVMSLQFPLIWTVPWPFSFSRPWHFWRAQESYSVEWPPTWTPLMCPLQVSVTTFSQE